MNVADILKQADLYSDDIEYILIRLPAQAIIVAAGILAEVGEPFAALIADKDEVTLVIAQDVLEEFSGRLRGHAVSATTYRLITYDIPLDLSLVGFMATVSSALAQAGISIMPLAAYSRDHILVQSSQFDAAMQTLKTLKSQ